MGFIYDTPTNTLIIKEIGINIRYLYNKEKEQMGLENYYNNLEWDDGTLIIDIDNTEHKYEIYLNKTIPNFYFIIKVKKLYFDSMFIDFFQLDADCCNWSKNIIIGIRKDQLGQVSIQ